MLQLSTVLEPFNIKMLVRENVLYFGGSYNDRTEIEFQFDFSVYYDSFTTPPNGYKKKLWVKDGLAYRTPKSKNPILDFNTGLINKKCNFF